MTATQHIAALAGTSASGVENYAVTAAPTATHALSLQADYLRSSADSLGGQVRDIHDQVRDLTLADRTLAQGKRSVAALLSELADHRGMAWADIAELAGVSVSAVRKWRKGGDASAESRGSLAKIAALLDLLEEKGLIEDPAQWMEMDLPLAPGFHIRPFDLYLEGHAVPLLDIAEHRRTVTQVLDSAMPNWRDRHSQFEVFTDTDGDRSIRMRGE